MSRPVVARLLENASWLALERIAVLAVAFVFNAWFVRYLGPAEYGRYSYAVSFAALFGSLATLGTDSLVVRELAREPEKAGEILGTAMALRVVAGALAWAGATAMAVVLRDDASTRALVGIASANALFLGAAVFELWFQAQIAARATSLGRIGVTLAVQLLRGALILAASPTWAFGVLYALAGAMTLATSYLLFVWTRPRETRLSFRASRAKDLLTDALPLAITAIGISVYLKIDQLMLVALVGERENGMYAPAALLSELFYFLPLAVSSSAFPVIVRALDALSPEEFGDRLQRFYDAMAGIGYAITIPMVLLAEPIVLLLFGSGYVQTGAVLRVHVLSFVFTALGIARGRYLIARGHTWFVLAATAVGAGLNVAMNVLLIPRHGALGAAWATVFSYAAANYLSGFLWRPMWGQTWMLTRAMLLPLRLLRRALPTAPSSRRRGPGGDGDRRGSP